jgi:hypothetical protein
MIVHGYKNVAFTKYILVKWSQFYNCPIVMITLSLKKEPINESRILFEWPQNAFFQGLMQGSFWCLLKLKVLKQFIGVN